MTAVNYTNARENFKKYCDAAVNDCEAIIVTRRQGENVVIISEAEYNNLLENLYVRSNLKDYKELLESVEQLKRGEGTIRELVDDEESLFRKSVGRVSVLDRERQEDPKKNQPAHQRHRA